MSEKKPIFSQEDVMKLLDSLYEKALDGIPYVSKSIPDMAEEYLSKYTDIEQAANAMIRNQVLKCTTSGVVTGFGGFITLPVTVPANVSSVLYVQMRMVACAACMGGYKVDSDQVQTLVYACLAGVAVGAIVKKAGLAFGNKVFINLVKKIPGSVITKINQKIGMRFITKFGEKGIVNLGKLVPGVGAIISGGYDFAETKIIADRAIKWFIHGDFTLDNDPKTDDFVVDADDIQE